MEQTVERVEVLIIGAGSIGCAIAEELAGRGQQGVLVVDRGKAGDGSSNRAAGGLRAQFPTEINVRMTLLSQPYFREMGDTIDWVESGYIYLGRNPGKPEEYQRNVAMQRALGVDVEMVDPDTLESRWPWLNAEGVIAATWCPTDAVFDQVKFMDVLVERAQAAGAEVREGVAVTGLRMDGDRVVGVETTAGSIEAGVTVLAAGAWSPPIAATVGLTLPVGMVRREIFTFERTPALPETTPFVADFDLGRYIAQNVNDLRMSGGMSVSDNPEAPVNLANGEAAQSSVSQLVPVVAGLRQTGGWAGLIESTPDGHALLGAAPGYDGLIIATGFSGHGVMHAPVTATLVAEMILDGAPSTLDIASLAPTRFAEG